MVTALGERHGIHSPKVKPGESDEEGGLMQFSPHRLRNMTGTRIFTPLEKAFYARYDLPKNEEEYLDHMKNGHDGCKGLLVLGGNRINDGVGPYANNYLHPEKYEHIKESAGGTWTGPLPTAKSTKKDIRDRLLPWMDS
jgi:hypothetical protein